MWTYLLLLLLLLLIMLALVLAWGRRRWRRATADLIERLGSRKEPAGTPSPAVSELDAAPEPVARYLRQVLPEGQALIRRARITWSGEFNLGKPGADSWKPFTATQEFVVDPPGFIWSARISMAPGVPVLVRDGLVAGEGLMEGKIAGVVPVVRRAGTPELAAAALQRYLSEALWFPTALLPGQGVTWTATNGTTARATLTSCGVTTSVEFRFDTRGRVASINVPDRLFDNGKDTPTPQPWQARIERWQEMEGIVVPAAAVAEWLLPTGTFAYWRGGPSKVEYEVAAPEKAA